MPMIEIQRVPGLPKERVKAPDSIPFVDWLSTQTLHEDVRIHINGKELSDDDEIGFTLKSDDRITIFDQPKGGSFVKGSALVLGAFTYKSDIKMFSKLTSKLFSQQSATGVTSKTSSNNSIKGQTNLARNGEAKPDNFGQVRSFPDLIQESLFEYTDNLKYLTEFMDFGLGEYTISSVRYSESNLGSMAGASYKVFSPGEVIPEIIEGYQFDDVDGQEVPGKNESEDFPIETATAETVVSGLYAGGQIAMKILKQSDFDYFVDLAMPHAVTFTINVTYNDTSGPVTQDVVLSGNLIDASESDNGSIEAPESYYTFVISNIEGSGASYVFSGTINNTTFVLNDNQALVAGPYFSPVDSDYLWIHTQSGLGGNSETNWQVTIWKVDDNNDQIAGTTETFTYRQTTPHDYTSETFYRTDKLTPIGGYGRYAISFQRTDNSSDASTLKVEAIHSVNIRNNVTYPNDTLVRVTTRQTENATSSRERKYNALITRHVISYSLDTQTVDYTLRASRKFADIAVHNWLLTGNQAESSIDIYGLYQIQSRLDAIDERLGYFDYTFDDEDVSLGQRMESICDAAGVTVYWDDGVLSFTLDAKRDQPVTVFNRANTKEDGYSLTYDMTLPGGYDGVEIQYRNPLTNKQDYVRYRITDGQIVLGAPTKAKKFEMLYIRNEYQADQRAQKECRRLIYSRMTMGITALADGEWVNVGDMVQVPDTYDTNQQAGYIVSRSGNNFETSERITFSGEMFVVVTDASGNTTGRYAATSRGDTSFGFTAALPNISLNLYDGYSVQSPSRYMIATEEELDATQWVISEKKPNGDGTTALTLEEYSDQIYV
ncbi:host specificity factor TipJ family phage tail protein [Pantoea sp. LMR881]|uniref:host specificity factor TipJ family phage tail protein n=1 Tax=Pantoea sp. LMR881 TaxID=3014336 RepID=UPI0022AEC7D2|nr:host specificity factor TipJ family phage tail protein [Pantoea sp. LMR881]MCZ4058022.1 host specificity factor TipJ family phage tail protein [Pantoea sp. LMR881]